MEIVEYPTPQNTFFDRKANNVKIFYILTKYLSICHTFKWENPTFFFLFFLWITSKVQINNWSYSQRKNYSL